MANERQNGSCLRTYPLAEHNSKYSFVRLFVRSFVRPPIHADAPNHFQWIKVTDSGAVLRPSWRVTQTDRKPIIEPGSSACYIRCVVVISFFDSRRLFAPSDKYDSIRAAQFRSSDVYWKHGVGDERTAVARLLIEASVDVSPSIETVIILRNKFAFRLRTEEMQLSRWW